MVGRGTEWVSVDRDLHLSPIGPVQPVDNGSDETSGVIVGQKVIESRRKQPTLVSLHGSQRHGKLLSRKLHPF